MFCFFPIRILHKKSSIDINRVSKVIKSNHHAIMYTNRILLDIEVSIANGVANSECTLYIQTNGRTGQVKTGGSDLLT